MKSRSYLRLLPILFAFIASFLWGYLTHRNQIFPYDFVRDMSIYFGVIHPPQQTPIEAPGQVVSEIDMLHELGYVDANPGDNPDEYGVTFIDEILTFHGPRLYTSVTSNEAYLIDVNGRALQTWSLPSQNFSTFVYLLDDGDLLVIERSRSLSRLSRDSVVRWSLPIQPHHDLDVWNDEIFVLTREERSNKGINRHHKIADDVVSVVSLDGEMLSQVSLLDIVESSEYRFLRHSVNDIQDDRSETEKHRALCLLHANHVEVIDDSDNWSSAMKTDRSSWCLFETLIRS